MSDVVNNAEGQNPAAATLSFPGGRAEFPIQPAIDGDSSLDLGTFTRQTGLTALDYGFVNTASTRSAITYIDGEQGILRYRGYPIEELAEHSTFLEVAWLLIYGELPTADQLGEFDEKVRRHTLLHEDLKRFFSALPHTAHPMAVLSSAVSALSTYYEDSSRPARPRARRAHHGAPAREAPRDRRVRAQEERRPGVPVPRQLARLRATTSCG